MRSLWEKLADMKGGVIHLDGERGNRLRNQWEKEAGRAY